MFDLDYDFYREHEFKSILMSMVAAGADIYAEDKYGLTVSELACRFDHEEVWIEVLAQCGYDPRAGFSLHESYNYFRDFVGMGVFSTVVPVIRPTKLSFPEYCEQQKSIFRPPPQPQGPWMYDEEYKYRQYLLENLSDSEDYETDDEGFDTEDEELYSEDGRIQDDERSQSGSYNEDEEREFFYDLDKYGWLEEYDEQYHEEVYDTEHGAEWWL
jgi:hypothetical protein